MNPTELLLGIVGPASGLLFVVVVAACFATACTWPGGDNSEMYALPAPEDLDAIAVALLRGKRTTVIQAAAFDLWCRGALNVAGARGKPILWSRPYGSDLGGPIHVAIYRFARSGLRATDLHDDAGLTSEVDGLLQPTVDRLQRLHLLRTEDERCRVARPFWVALGATLCFGGACLLLDLLLRQPTEYVVIPMFGASLLTLIIVIHKTTGVSRPGQQYLASVRAHYAPLRQQLEGGLLPEGISYALLSAVFGGDFVSRIPAFQAFGQVFDGAATGENTGSGCGCG